MPELPEVEVVRRGLADHVVGRAFSHVAVTGERSARRHALGKEHLAQTLTGRTVASAQRRGKYLWLTFAGRDGEGLGEALVIHLGMSGQVLVEAADAPLEKHAHAVFDLSPRVGEGGEFTGNFTENAESESADPEQMRFVDQRTFGGLFLDPLTTAHARHVPASIEHIAPDPLEDAFDPDAVARLMHSKNVAIKRMLLDQAVISGVGNIYADEALWRGKIHGQQPGSALSAAQLQALLRHVAEVMEEALDQGGTSFDAMYVNVNGASGYFSRSLNVYGQQGKPCPRCGVLIVREQFMNRSSHFCPACQLAP